MRRRMIYRGSNYEQSASKESDNSIEKRENAREQSFMELLNSSPIRSPSPAGPATEQESTSQTLTDWGYQVRQIFVSILKVYYAPAMLKIAIIFKKNWI